MSGVPREINDVIDTFINGVKKILKNRVKKIILYGSYARGDYNKDSDIEYDNNFDIQLSLLVKNIDKFNYWLEALPFYMNIQKEGVVLSES